MQISLNIDAAHLKEEVASTLNAMTPEMKYELVREAVKTYISEPMSKARSEWLEMAVGEFKANITSIRSDKEIRYNNNWRKIDTLTDSEIQASSDFDDWFKKNESRFSLRAQLIDALIPAVVAEARKQVDDLVKTDPVVQETISKIVAEAKTAMPQFIESALTLHFTKTIGAMFSDASQAMMNSRASIDAVSQMQQKLNQRGIY